MAATPYRPDVQDTTYILLQVVLQSFIGRRLEKVIVDKVGGRFNRLYDYPLSPLYALAQLRNRNRSF